MTAVARACERPTGRESALARESRAKRATRLGRREVRCGVVRGGTQRGGREGEDARRKDHRSERSERRGPQRAHRALVAGALEVIAASLTTYLRAAGALEAITARATYYKQEAESPKRLTEPAATYQQYSQSQYSSQTGLSQSAPRAEQCSRPCRIRRT